METALYARNAGPAELKKMERIYADLVAKYPKNAAVKNVQGEFYWNISDHKRAVETWLAAEKLDPNNAAVLDHLGGSFLAAGEPRKAAGYFSRALTNDPGNAFYHFNYANVAYLFRHDLLDTKHPDAAAVLRLALSHFAEAARLEPLNPEYARAYAETFYTIPDPDWRTALQAWQRFHDITPNKDSALLNLARVHIRLGQKTEAKETLARIQNPQLARIKAKLEESIDAK
jgi:tetratricopeptide (TPR) repeat protein